MSSHTACPVALPIGDGLVRIYFGTRNADNRSSVGYLVIHMDDPLTVLDLADREVLGLGGWGRFDEHGVFPGCLVQHEGGLWLYYIGRTNGVPPLYYMAIGIAESRDGGVSFQRLRPDPIMSRSPYDPWMASTPFVLKRNSSDWVMWYLSGVGWDSVDPPVARYNVKVAHSIDGANWSRNGAVAFDFESQEANLASPYVWQSANGFEAVFCAASPGRGYELHGARSKDCVSWQRTGTLQGLELSTQGWDAECMAYPSSFVHNARRYLLYSGNGNGREGFGIAVEQLT